MIKYIDSKGQVHLLESEEELKKKIEENQKTLDEDASFLFDAKPTKATRKTTAKPRKPRKSRKPRKDTKKFSEKEQKEVVEPKITLEDEDVKTTFDDVMRIVTEG